MATGKKAASEAGRQLGSKSSTKQEKSVAGSTLADTPRKAPAKGRGSGKK
jgi:hypothetical protein